MASTTTLAALTLAAQQRADMENGTFISASEWTNMVNASCRHLYDKLIEAYGNDYELATAYAITTDGTNYTYALPTLFYKLLGVDLQIGTSWVTVWRFNFADRNRWTLPGAQTALGRATLKYRLAGNNIWFAPLPAAGLSLQLWYAPAFTALVNSTDTFDGINGWEEWVINDVAMKAKVKEESPIEDLKVLQAIQNERLQSVMESRDAGAPMTTVDVYAANRTGYGYGGDPESGW